MKIAQEGYPFIFISAVITILLALVSVMAALIPLVITFFMIYFFRDPDRSIPDDKDVLISPADGKIIVIEKVFESNYLQSECTKISIFMSPFNVHVNRVPCDCNVLDVVHKKGKFLSAFKPEASIENENISLLVDTIYGKILIRQIAGFVARRAVCRARAGDSLKKGERFGIIKFSSRVDIFIPLTFTPSIKLNEKVYAGESIIARFKKNI